MGSAAGSYNRGISYEDESGEHGRRDGPSSGFGRGGRPFERSQVEIDSVYDFFKTYRCYKRFFYDDRVLLNVCGLIGPNATGRMTAAGMGPLPVLVKNLVSGVRLVLPVTTGAPAKLLEIERGPMERATKRTGGERPDAVNVGVSNKK